MRLRVRIEYGVVGEWPSTTEEGQIITTDADWGLAPLILTGWRTTPGTVGRQYVS
jgi:hypothetical protein